MRLTLSSLVIMNNEANTVLAHRHSMNVPIPYVRKPGQPLAKQLIEEWVPVAAVTKVPPAQAAEGERMTY